MIENVITEKMDLKPMNSDPYELVIETEPHEFKKYQEPPKKMIQPQPKKVILTEIKKIVGQDFEVKDRYQQEEAFFKLMNMEK